MIFKEAIDAISEGLEMMQAPRIHPTAMIEHDVVIGAGTSVWDHVHIRHGSQLGTECLVGGKTTIAYDVQIGDRVKINSGAYLCYGVTLEDGVMISAGVIFTNDRFPRACTPDLKTLKSSEPDEETLATRVREGATVGAGAIIGPGLTIGRFAMVGMGSVVTKPVGDFELVVGNPARLAGIVCRCGQLIVRGRNHADFPATLPACVSCGQRLLRNGEVITEMSTPHQTVTPAAS